MSLNTWLLTSRNNIGIIPDYTWIKCTVKPEYSANLITRVLGHDGSPGDGPVPERLSSPSTTANPRATSSNSPTTYGQPSQPPVRQPAAGYGPSNGKQPTGYGRQQPPPGPPHQYQAPGRMNPLYCLP
ncbi:hypothetical protein M501DRAFT_1051279 [Patellaria atrata CBS 101060]|uniref:Uncharacterized protein n=1 Tax=Patellaria atrata CBS 101060 TaxID=1346257 RepID=A0A9P4SAM7_9PEZI|nr:hypothetical protein M501DRAFT_1051279 [Patellaria atrata CBS 101060]